MRLLQEGTCRIEEIGSYSEEELRHLLGQCDIPFTAEDCRVSIEAGGGDPGFGSRLVSIYAYPAQT